MFELLMFILVIATIILILLYTVAGPPAKPSVGGETPVGKKSSPGKASSRNHTSKKRQTSTHPKKDSQKCPYGFGNLAKRDRTTPIPDECLSCSKMLECSGSSER